MNKGVGVIGIIIAMHEEFSIDSLEIKKITINNQIYYQYQDSHIFTFSGIGKINAAIAAQLLLINFKITKLINIGSAGALNSSLEINDIIICDKIFNYDFDLSSFGYQVGQMPLKERNYLNSQGAFKNQLTSLLKNDNFNLKFGNLATGDSFISQSNIKNFKLLAKEDVAIVDMEGFSFAYVCDKNEIEIIIIKIVSDSVNLENQNAQFKKNINQSKSIIQKIINHLLTIRD
ncbi:MAG: 5'-methylthioadenosine/S-adenosylhomocysteine nucleosidase [Mycoplasmoidaceae bacterium]